MLLFTILGGAKLRRRIHIIEVRVGENSTADYQRRDLVGVSIDKKIGAIIKF
jgi:hypothetical protein